MRAAPGGVEGRAARRPHGRDGAVEAAVGGPQRVHQAPQGVLRRTSRRSARAIRARKEDLAQQAEALSGSTDWGADGGRLPRADAVLEGRRAGPTGPPRTSCGSGSRRAQDTFFQARVGVLAAEGRRAAASNAMAKEQLLAEAEKLLPVTDLRAARRAARHPGALGARRARCRATRRSGSRAGCGGSRRRSARPRTSSGGGPTRRRCPGPAARSTRSAATISQLEGQLAKAQASGRRRGPQQAQEALAARQSWLAEAERTLADLTG